MEPPCINILVKEINMKIQFNGGQGLKDTVKQVASKARMASHLVKHTLNNPPQALMQAATIADETQSSSPVQPRSSSRIHQTWDLLNMPIYVSPKQAREKLAIENPKPGAVFFKVPESLSSEDATKTVALGPYASHNNPNGEAYNIGLLAKASGKNPVTNTGLVAVSDGPATNLGLVAAQGGDQSHNVSLGLAQGGRGSENDSVIASVGGEASFNNAIGVSQGGNRSKNASVIASIGEDESKNMSLFTARGGDRSSNAALIDATGKDQSINMAAVYAGGGQESTNAGALVAEGTDRSQNASFVLAKGGEASHNRSHISISEDGATNEGPDTRDFVQVGACIGGHRPN